MVLLVSVIFICSYKFVFMVLCLVSGELFWYIKCLRNIKFRKKNKFLK